MEEQGGKFTDRWKRLRQTSGFKNSMLLLVFIAISTLFWFIMALNDSAQDSFNVGIEIYNKPDSVTFISDFPEKVHVTVRDKGTSLWRAQLKQPVLQIDYREFASDGVVRLTMADLQTSLKNLFGPSSQIISVSIDSLRLEYTSNKGKKVPVIADCTVIPASGNILEGEIILEPSSVFIFGEQKILDTVNYITTEPLVIRDVSETTTIEVKLQRLKKAIAKPSTVKVIAPIEPLVMKEALVTISTLNVPKSESLLLFPSRVPVKYFVAMSRLSDDEDNNIQLIVDYNDLRENPSRNKLQVKVDKYPDRLKNLQLEADSVEFAIVRQ